jgi:hypothetical protein
MAAAASYGWLETLLTLLFECYDADAAHSLARDKQARQHALRELEPRLRAAGADADLLASNAGDNLCMAVLALRLKFSKEEAFDKVRLNIAMRGG